MLLWEKANNMSCVRETDHPRNRDDLRCLMERNQHAQWTASTIHWACVSETSSNSASRLQTSLIPRGAEECYPHWILTKTQIHGLNNVAVLKKKKYSVFNNWNNLSSASLSHTILYIPHHGSHHPVWPRWFCLLHQKWEILPPNFSYKEALIHIHPGDQRETQKWRHSMLWISHHGTQNAGAQRSGICWYNVSLPLLVVIFLFSAEWWH